MHEKAIQDLVEQIIQIANQSTKDISVREKAKRQSKILGAKGFAFCIVDDAVDLYNNLCSKLLKRPDWSSRFSEQYISKKIHRLLATILENEATGNTQKIFEYVEQLVTELENFSQEQLVLIPLTGIVMRIDSLELGRIVLRNVTTSYTEELIADKKAAISQSNLPSEEKEKAIQNLYREASKVFINPTCAEFRVVAEPNRARERAEEESRRVLDLLRYSISLLFKKDQSKKGLYFDIGLWQEAIRTTRETLVFTLSSKNFSRSSELAGAGFDFVLEPQIVQELEIMGIFKVAQILKKSTDEVTGFEETLLRGIHWFVNAQTQNEKENDLLSLITCLETFLTSENSDKISNTVAEGVAFVLGPNLELRKHFKKRIKDFYSKRSRVSHGGQKAILDSELEELRTLTAVFLAIMIRRKDEFRERKDLDDWIEKQKLS